jgi:hypothetical protein
MDVPIETENPYSAGRAVWYIRSPRLQFLGLAGSSGPSQSTTACAAGRVGDDVSMIDTGSGDFSFDELSGKFRADSKEFMMTVLSSPRHGAISVRITARCCVLCTTSSRTISRAATCAWLCIALIALIHSLAAQPVRLVSITCGSCTGPRPFLVADEAHFPSRVNPQNRASKLCHVVGRCSPHGLWHFAPGIDSAIPRSHET